jgi:hypothetical protein
VAAPLVERLVEDEEAEAVGDVEQFRRFAPIAFIVSSCRSSARGNTAVPSAPRSW